MNENYITLSLETHLFFARIMKEHALFLEAGFPCKEQDWIQKADYFRQQFEILLMEVIQLSDEQIRASVLNSNELTTEFTIPAERKTEAFSGIPINTELSRMENALRPVSMQSNRNNSRKASCQNSNNNNFGRHNIPNHNNPRTNNRELIRLVHRLNERSIVLLNGLIDFKRSILREVGKFRLFTFNYPLLIEHILREARLYRSSIESLMRNRSVSYNTSPETARRTSRQGYSQNTLLGTEEFWNQIMMEHALFIRGLLDPSEEKLIETANTFASEYKLLLETEEHQDGITERTSAQKSLEETLKYRDFKTAGTKGILNCEIVSIILPLLADHVLREANHYIRLLENDLLCEEK